MPHAGHDTVTHGGDLLIGISTHVPHAGHDPPLKTWSFPRLYFNSRAPCGARPCGKYVTVVIPIFQLTCPMRGTTRQGHAVAADIRISTHVPHAGHDSACMCATFPRSHFNSRAPCGARLWTGTGYPTSTVFQLTCPMRGTTVLAVVLIVPLHISTHVPHAGHDGRVPLRRLDVGYFNSRAPCGARRGSLIFTNRSREFQLTCPMRGTTDQIITAIDEYFISTHVPHAGHDKT